MPRSLPIRRTIERNAWVFLSVAAAEATILVPYTSWSVLGSNGTPIAGGTTGATSGPPPVFSSIVNAMNATLDAYTTWVVFGNNDTIIAGGTTGATSGPIYPARTGKLISFADIEPSADAGYLVKSGGITGVIDNGGTGYAALDVVTDASTEGLIEGGARATWTVTEVDGGGAGPGVVTAIAPLTVGDYSEMPDVAATLATTNDGAGDDALTLGVATQVPAGVTVDGSGFPVATPSDTTKTVTISLPIWATPADPWAFARSMDVHMQLTSAAQLTYASDVELSSRVEIRLPEVGGADFWAAGGFHAVTAIGDLWEADVQDSNLGQAIGDSWELSAGDNVSATLSFVRLNGVGNTPFMFAEIADLDSVSKIKGLSVALQSVVGFLGYFWNTDPTFEDDGLKHVLLKFAAGPTAGDTFAVTLTALQGCDMGWDQR